MNLQNYWQNSVTYEEYLQEAKRRLETPRNQEDIDFKTYYELGLQRMERMQKRYKPDSGQKELLEAKDFKGKVLIIAEPWCGDASQVVPVVMSFFAPLEVRISYRDQENSPIDHFLSGGAKSIPVVILLDEDCNEIGHWGARPQHGNDLLKRYKDNPEEFPKEEFYLQLQKYYAQNKGFDTIAEILELL